MFYGSYKLELQCDNIIAGRLRCSAWKKITTSSAEKARKLARAEGWKLVLTKSIVLCPRCNGKYRSKAHEARTDHPA